MTLLLLELISSLKVPGYFRLTLFYEVQPDMIKAFLRPPIGKIRTFKCLTNKKMYLRSLKSFYDLCMHLGRGLHYNQHVLSYRKVRAQTEQYILTLTFTFSFCMYFYLILSFFNIFNISHTTGVHM